MQQPVERARSEGVERGDIPSGRHHADTLVGLGLGLGLGLGPGLGLGLR